MLKNKKKTLRKIMSDKKRRRNVPLFLWENLGIIICLYYNYMRTRSYNNYKNSVPENLFKRYETFLYNSPSNKCKTKQQSFIRMKHICKNIRATGHEVNSNT